MSFASTGSGRIFHHVTSEPTTVSRCLEMHFRVSADRFSELLSLGAIYMNRRRVTEDMSLSKGAYLRLHLQPKRFPVDSINWKAILVHETRDFVIVNKPAGIPVHATVDNQCDNVLYQLRQALGTRLLVTQRIDIPVSGLVLFAKNAEFQRLFNRWLGERRIEKRYEALTEVEVPLGLHVHYMEPSERSPKRVSLDENTGWARCELSILSSKPAFNGELFSSAIVLHTGRTHQIRAQLSALGCAIVGDRMYGSKRGFNDAGHKREAMGLCSTFLSFSWSGTIQRFELEPPWSVSGV